MKGLSESGGVRGNARLNPGLPGRGRHDIQSQPERHHARKVISGAVPHGTGHETQPSVLPDEYLTPPQIPPGLPLAPGRRAAEDLFSATAARMSAFSASSSILSPSWKSMARLVLPSRLELKRPEGSSNEAPLAKVIFTTFLYVSPVQIIPSCDHTGTPLHFHSSITSGSACFMRIRTRASVSPRQSLSSLILASIS